MKRLLFLALVLAIPVGCQSGSPGPSAPSPAPAVSTPPRTSVPAASLNNLSSPDRAERLAAAVNLVARTDGTSKDLVRHYLTNRGSELTRASVIEALRVSPDPDFAPLVVENLASPSHLCREAASGTLPVYDRSVVGYLLLARLDDPSLDLDARRRVIIALGVLREQHAIEPLVQLLDESQLLEAVSQALQDITGESFVTAADWRTWWQLAHASSQSKWPARDTVVDDPRPDPPDARKHAATPDEVAQFMVKVLQQRDPAKDPQILLDALQMPYERVRVYAADEFGRLKSVEALEPLSDVALTDRAPAVRIASVNALVLIDPTKVVPTLQRALRDADPAVAAAAATGLGKAAASTAVNPLIFALDHKSPVVRGAAADALGRIGDKRAVRSLLKLLASDPSVEVRQQSARALGVLKDKQALPELLRALDSTEPSLRIFAIDALGEIGDPSVLVQVRQKLNADDNPGVRESAAVTLGKLGDPDALPALRLALRQDDEKLRQLAFGAIINICRPSPALLAETANDLMTDRDYARAVQLFELVLETANDKPDLAPTLQAARRSLSRCYVAGEQWTRALKLLEDLLRTSPDDPVLVEDYARALAGAKKWADAFHQYARLAQLASRENGCWPERLALLDAMIAEKRCEQVVDLVREVERAQPQPAPPIPARLREIRKTCQLQLVEEAAAAPDGPDRLVKFLASDDETELEAAKSKLRKSTTPVYPALVNGLADANPKLRRGCFELLRELTGKTFDYDPEGPADARARAVALWRDWLKSLPAAAEAAEPKKN